MKQKIIIIIRNILIIITIMVQHSNRKDKAKVTEPKRNKRCPTQLLTIC